MAFGDADLDVFMTDFAVSVVVGSVLIKGIKDTQSDVVLGSGGAGVIGSLPAIRVKASDVAARNIAIGTALTVDGTAYTVREPVSLGPDGAFVRLWLSEA